MVPTLPPLSRRQSCPIAPAKWSTPLPAPSDLFLNGRSRLSLSLRLAGLRSLTPAGDSFRSLHPAPHQSRETAPALWSLPRAASISLR